METADTRYFYFAEVRAPVGMSADELLEKAIEELGVWGGMSSSTIRNDDLEVIISFDPTTAVGGVDAIVAWLDALDVEYTLELKRLAKDWD